MKVEELKAVVEAMTEAPWTLELDRNEQQNIHAPGQPTDWIAILPHQCVGSIEKEQERNATGIVSLRNHADALVDLAAAARRHLDEGGGLPPDVISALLRLEAIP